MQGARLLLIDMFTEGDALFITQASVIHWLTTYWEFPYTHASHKSICTFLKVKIFMATKYNTSITLIIIYFSTSTIQYDLSWVNMVASTHSLIAELNIYP